MSNASSTQTQVGNSAVTVGRFTYGTEHLSVRQYGEGASLTIGSFCSIASEVTVFLGGNHRVDWITTFPFGHIFESELGGRDIKGHPASNGDVVIGHDVWVGHGATIMSGVHIGDGAVIAANANVVKDVAPYEIVGGNPARHIRFRFDEGIRHALLTLRWWELTVREIRLIAQVLSSAPTEELVAEMIRRFRGGPQVADPMP